VPLLVTRQEGPRPDRLENVKQPAQGGWVIAMVEEGRDDLEIQAMIDPAGLLQELRQLDLPQ